MIVEYKIDYSVHSPGKKTAGPLGIPKHARIAVVGNGPSVLQHKHGQLVDSCDEVIRFNDFRLSGHEEHTGRKVTIWVRNGGAQKPEVKPDRSIHIHKDIPREFYAEWREKLQKGTKLSDPERLLPSTGFLILAWLVKESYRRVYLTGFDGFSKEHSSQHHYWIPRAFKRPKEHDGDQERKWVQRWIREGKLRPVSALVQGGPGTELKKLLSRIGIRAIGNCKCNARAREMDRRGADWCRANTETIVGWLKEEAGRRRLPFSALAARQIVRLAIRRAEKKPPV